MVPFILRKKTFSGMYSFDLFSLFLPPITLSLSLNFCVLIFLSPKCVPLTIDFELFVTAGSCLRVHGYPAFKFHPPSLTIVWSADYPSLYTVNIPCFNFNFSSSLLLSLMINQIKSYREADLRIGVSPLTIGQSIQMETSVIQLCRAPEKEEE